MLGKPPQAFEMRKKLALTILRPTYAKDILSRVVSGTWSDLSCHKITLPRICYVLVSHLCWKNEEGFFENSKKKKVIRMVNPLPQDVTDDQSLPGSGAKKRRVEKKSEGGRLWKSKPICLNGDPGLTKDENEQTLPSGVRCTIISMFINFI